MKPCSMCFNKERLFETLIIMGHYMLYEWLNHPSPKKMFTPVVGGGNRAPPIIDSPGCFLAITTIFDIDLQKKRLKSLAARSNLCSNPGSKPMATPPLL